MCTALLACLFIWATCIPYRVSVHIGLANETSVARAHQNSRGDRGSERKEPIEVDLGCNIDPWMELEHALPCTTPHCVSFS
jgi:hypothetical protein